jgi:hypothetical protein
MPQAAPMSFWCWPERPTGVRRGRWNFFPRDTEGRVVLDVPTNAKVYEFTQIELAQKYAEDLPQSAPVSICPIHGLSIKDGTREAEKCLQREEAKSVLIVTSDVAVENSFPRNSQK